MGAWGHNAFENDGAMDWVGAFMDADEGLPGDDDDEAMTKEVLLIGPLGSITELPADEYIEADLATDAVAAAEVVAALFGKPSSELLAAAEDTSETEGNTLGQLMGWVAGTKTPLKARTDLRELARDALARVERSELAELWAESESAADWKKSMQDLARRLA